MLLRDRPRNGEPRSSRLCDVFYNNTVILATFNMVLDVQVIKSLIEKHCIARGLAPWTAIQSRPEAVQRRESRNSLYLGAKCGHVLGAFCFVPTAGIVSVDFDRFCIVPKIKTITIRHVRQLPSQGCWSTCAIGQAGYTVRMQAYGGGKAFRMVLGNTRLPNVACWQVGQLASVSQNSIGVETRRSAARCQQGNRTTEFPCSAAWSFRSCLSR